MLTAVRKGLQRSRTARRPSTITDCAETVVPVWSAKAHEQRAVLGTKAGVHSYHLLELACVRIATADQCKLIPS